MKFFCVLGIAVCLASPAFAQHEIPKVADARLVVELVAQAPDIVHPVSCDFDHKGRLLVIESHTHFAPKDYKGPKHDRILAFDVSKPGSKPTIFFEGMKHTMDLAVHPDGSVYVATRNEILRLHETKDGVKSVRIVYMETKGNYPHNGLSGLCFDSKGDLTFGMGENLGVHFKLIGSDGTTITDEQGGHIFHCTADGKKLRRVATGFWNPFGICRDIYGRMFCVDNDPDQSPPCRMVHVVEGGDYGYRFCYGRSGRHPFQSWHGELPGTLPMMTGVGEAPCEILSYESDGLPKEYLGKLMVTSWADHRVELYKVVPHGASFKAERQPFVQGGNNFRPVGLCVAPDGSLYVSDWVLSNYNLHGKGAIWRVRMKDDTSRERKRPADPKEALLSDHWPLREAAAKKLADDGPNRGHVINRWAGDGRPASASLDALIQSKDSKPTSQFLEVIVKKSTDPGIQEMAMRELVRRGELKNGIITDKSPASLRRDWIQSLDPHDDEKLLIAALSEKDPFLYSAAIQRLAAKKPDAFFVFHKTVESKEARSRLGGMLALRQMLPKANIGERIFIGPLLSDADEEIRFMSVKWIADEKLKDRRKDIEKLMADPKLSVRMYMACATALARIDGKEVNEKSLADYFVNRLADAKTPAAQLPMLLRQVPASHPKLTVDLLMKLLKSDDTALKMEAVRALVEHSSPKRDDVLLAMATDPTETESLRSWAVVGLSPRAQKYRNDLYRFARGKEPRLRDEALRTLVDVPTTVMDLGELHALPLDEATSPLVNRISKDKFFKDRPATKDIDGWLKRLDGKADADAGARVFFHPKLAGCAKCHRIDGRGADVGPDLSSIGRVERRAILESILQPSANVAPHYVAWHLETADGKVRNGMLLHTYLDEYTYLDAKGERFKVRTGDLVEQRPLTTSIMPDGLVDRLTDQEIRDLLAYLQARK
ncbi:MAG: c-type cytochrome [Planctomycetes bacterium]|nr:c-type cytochrome [Planctomycetota bacterium]